MVVCSIPCSLSISSARPEVRKDGHFYERCPEGDGVLKGHAGNVKLDVLVDWTTSSAARNDLLFPRCSHLARLMEVIVA